MIHSYTLPHRKSKIKDPKFFLITFLNHVLHDHFLSKFFEKITKKSQK
jgi:hypothetical protein